MPTTTNIDHDKKFIYVHVPKCAGKLIEKYFFGKEPVNGSSNHHTIEKILSLEENIDDYFVFSTVRNPWDRVVSGWYAEKKRRSIDAGDSFENFILNHRWKVSSGGREYHYYLKYPDGSIIENLYKVEDINTEKCPIQELGKKFDIELPERFDKVNPTHEERKPYQEYYTKKTRQIVYDHLGYEIELFNYKFE